MFFCPIENIYSFADTIFQKLEKENYLKGVSQDEFCKKAADLFGDINALHPFREGNGRTQRLFLYHLAKNAGYELDLNKLNDEEKEEIKKQVAWYKQYRDVIQKGTFYRIKSPFDGNDISWNFISEDENTVICYFHQVLVEPIYRNLILKLKGLQEDALYNLVGTDKVFSGSELMYAGLMIPKIEEDFYSNIYVFKKSV